MISSPPHQPLDEGSPSTERRTVSPLENFQRLQSLDLTPASSIQELPLWGVSLDINCLVLQAIQVFQASPFLPGLILTDGQQYVGMVSRRRFFENLSRPFSLELFSKRPLKGFYGFIQVAALILPKQTPIVEAAQRFLQRSPDLVYEPIVVDRGEQPDQQYCLLDTHVLLVAQSQIHLLTTTALNQSEANARQKTEQLEQTLQELRRTHAQLVQNEKMSALGQLVAGVAHEINNPVNFIAGNLGHAKEYAEELLHLVDSYQQAYPEPLPVVQAEIEAVDLEFLSEDLPKLLKSMQMGVDRIQEIVKSLRIFSRIEESDFKAVDLHECLDSTLMILHNRLKPKGAYPGIRVLKNYGQLPLVECYAGQLNQVFINLISNAIDALEEGFAGQEVKPAIAETHPLPKITISTQVIHSPELDPEGTHQPWIKVSIADNGPGIPNEVQAKLFETFFTTKPIGKGTGLGLSISYQIVTEKHRGRLSCRSAPHQGTEFTIEIPMVQVLEDGLIR